jgi:hypothetical protein
MTSDFSVLAFCRTAQWDNWGTVIKFVGKDGAPLEVAVSWVALHLCYGRTVGDLAELGLEVGRTVKAREAFSNAVMTKAKPEARVTLATPFRYLRAKPRVIVLARGDA